MNIKLRESGSDIAKKTLMTLVSTFIMGLGMAVMLRAGIGLDPFTLFVGSIAELLGPSAGLAANIANALFFVIVLLVDRRLIYFATIIVFATIGIMLDGSAYMLGFILPPIASFELNVVVLIVGSILFGFGTGFYVSLDFGGGPADAIVIIIYKTIKKLPYKASVWIFYILCVLLAMLFGVISGNGDMPGVGTVIALIVVGIICDMTIKFFKKRWKKILKLDGDPSQGLAGDN